MDKNQIFDLIPHRPPFLWIDRISDLEAGERCVALKFVDPADPIFAGHFPGNAILPGVLLIEAAAQTAGVMLAGSAAGTPSGAARDIEGRTYLLGAVQRFKFLKPVRPGSEMRIETRKLVEVGSLAYIEATIWVGEDRVAQGELAVATA